MSAVIDTPRGELRTCTSVGYERQEYVYIYIRSYSGKELSQSGVCDNSFLFGDYMNGPR